MSNLIKTFFKDSTFYSLQPLFSKLITFFLLPLYTAYLTPADYGNLQYILTFGAFFRAFIQMGLHSSYWRFRSKESNFSKGEVAISFTLSQILIGLTALLLIVFIQFSFRNNSPLIILTIIYLLAVIINTLYETTLVFLRANHQAKKYLFITISQTTLLLLSNFFLIGYLRLDFKGVIYSYFIVFTLSSLASTLILYKEFEGKFKLSISKEMIRYGYPIMLGNIAGIIVSLSDRFFLKEFSTENELGLYSYAYKFADLLVAFLIQTFQLAWNPIRWQIYEMENGKAIFAKFYRYIIMFFPILGLIIISIIIILGNWMTVDKIFLQGFRIIILLAFSNIFYGLYWFSTMGLHFKNKTRILMYVILIGAITNIGLNFLFIPTLGMLGAALATIISYLLMFIIGSAVSQKYYHVEKNKRFEAIQLFFMIVTIVTLTLIYYKMDNIYILSLITVMYAILIFILNFVMGYINIDDLILIKNKLSKKEIN